MEMNLEYCKEVTDTLAMNIGLLGVCLKDDGVNDDDVDRLVKDTSDFISERASKIKVKHPHITENIINVVVMVLMHVSLKAQEEAISTISSKLGVSEEMIITEMTKDTIRKFSKNESTESESDKLLRRYDGRD